MAAYRVVLAESVEEFLERLDLNEKLRVVKRIEKLAESPYTVGEPRGKFWILKVGRAGYRLAYTVDEQQKAVLVSAMEKRKSWRYDRFYR